MHSGRSCILLILVLVIGCDSTGDLPEVQPPTLTLISPDGDETFVRGEPMTITYTQTGLDSLVWRISRSGVVEQQASDSIAANDSIVVELDPDLPLDDDYRVVLLGGGIADSTSGFFEITASEPPTRAECTYEPDAAVVTVQSLIYRTPMVDEANSATVLPDGRILVSGFTDGRIGAGDWTNAYPLLLWVSPHGAVDDTTVYRSSFGEALATAPIDDGLAVFVRIEQAVRPDAPDLLLYRTDEHGTRDSVLLEFPDSFPTGRPIVRTEGDGFILVEDEMFFFDRTGTLTGTTSLTFSARDYSVDPDGIYAFFRDSYSFTLVRLGLDGVERWRRSHGTGALRRADKVVALDDGAAVLGMVRESNSETESVTITRILGDGTLAWEQAYATGFIETVSASEALSDGGLAISYSEHYGGPSHGPGQTCAAVVRLAADGSVLWTRPFGPSFGTTAAKTLVSLPDGRIAVVGITGPESIGGYGGDDFDIIVSIYAE